MNAILINYVGFLNITQNFTDKDTDLYLISFWVMSIDTL